ncbi:MAG TPA: DoxX family protein [Dehalococcoidia bacterium]|nr:DoxX family protein [Dehalococcoidia bacterium]
MKDLGLLALRLTTGGLLMGHGSQKLFGKFNGPGLEGTGGWLESLGMKPGQRWALLAGGSEFGGGLLTALGLLSPIGPITTIAPMAMATGTVHRGKPIWVTEGGAELPVSNMAAAAALALTGPGKLSLDGLLGIRVPKALTLLALLGTAAGIGYGMKLHMDAQQAREEQAEGFEAEPGGEAGAQQDSPQPETARTHEGLDATLAESSQRSPG